MFRHCASTILAGGGDLDSFAISEEYIRQKRIQLDTGIAQDIKVNITVSISLINIESNEICSNGLINLLRPTFRTTSFFRYSSKPTTMARYGNPGVWRVITWLFASRERNYRRRKSWETTNWQRNWPECSNCVYKANSRMAACNTIDRRLFRYNTSDDWMENR